MKYSIHGAFGCRHLCLFRHKQIKKTHRRKKWKIATWLENPRGIKNPITSEVWRSQDRFLKGKKAWMIKTEVGKCLSPFLAELQAGSMTFWGNGLIFERMCFFPPCNLAELFFFPGGGGRAARV